MKEFTISEVLDIVKNSNYFDDLSLAEAVQLRNDIFDLKEMFHHVEKVLFDESLSRWIAKYSKDCCRRQPLEAELQDYCRRFCIHEENGRRVLPLWIGNILNEYVLSKIDKDCND